jgi:hypothetical protein
VQPWPPPLAPPQLLPPRPSRRSRCHPAPAHAAVNHCRLRSRLRSLCCSVAAATTPPQPSPRRPTPAQPSPRALTPPQPLADAAHAHDDAAIVCSERGPGAHCGVGGGRRLRRRPPVRPPRVGWCCSAACVLPPASCAGASCRTSPPSLPHHHRERCGVDNLFYYPSTCSSTSLSLRSVRTCPRTRRTSCAACNYSYDAANVEEYPALRGLPDS